MQSINLEHLRAIISWRFGFLLVFSLCRHIQFNWHYDYDVTSFLLWQQFNSLPEKQRRLAMGTTTVRPCANHHVSCFLDDSPYQLLQKRPDTSAFTESNVVSCHRHGQCLNCSRHAMQNSAVSLRRAIEETSKPKIHLIPTAEFCIACRQAMVARHKQCEGSAGLHAAGWRHVQWNTPSLSTKPWGDVWTIDASMWMTSQVAILSVDSKGLPKLEGATGLPHQHKACNHSIVDKRKPNKEHLNNHAINQPL